MIKIAKFYIELGGEIIIFSHGGEYEYLAKDLGCEIVRIEPIGFDGKWPNEYFLQHSDNDIIQIIKNEVSSYNATGIKLLVNTNIFLVVSFHLGSQEYRLCLLSLVHYYHHIIKLVSQLLTILSKIISHF
ncbi:MAG: hypothetical protein QHH19_00915 [Candidatus Thermoplasmatota archaeon]|nr:hypothetical protein [Candidatus Thermoplasmatota archaeon]